MARISNYEKTSLSKGIVDDINKTIFGAHNPKVDSSSLSPATIEKSRFR